MIVQAYNNISEDSDEDVASEESEVDVYRRKYHLLMERCEVLQQDNERLVHRIQKGRAILKRIRKQRRALIKRLDRYSDTWRNIALQISIDEPRSCPASSPEPTEEMITTASTPVNKTPTPAEKIVPKNSTVANSDVTNKAGNSVLTNNSEKNEKESIVSHAAAVSTDKVSPTTGSNIKKKLHVGQGFTKTLEKGDKDLNAPKRPANPFFQFCQEQRPIIVEKMTNEQKCSDPEAAKQELTRQLASKWNTLSQEEKKVYYDRYDKSKERYAQEMKAYVKKLHPEDS